VLDTTCQNGDTGEAIEQAPLPSHVEEEVSEPMSVSSQRGGRSSIKKKRKKENETQEETLSRIADALERMAELIEKTCDAFIEKFFPIHD
jgi:hypothetical protein